MKGLSGRSRKQTHVLSILRFVLICSCCFPGACATNPAEAVQSSVSAHKSLQETSFSAESYFPPKLGYFPPKFKLVRCFRWSDSVTCGSHSCVVFAWQVRDGQISRRLKSKYIKILQKPSPREIWSANSLLHMQNSSRKGFQWKESRSVTFVLVAYPSWVSGYPGIHSKHHLLYSVYSFYFASIQSIRGNLSTQWHFTAWPCLSELSESQTRDRLDKTRLPCKTRVLQICRQNAEETALRLKSCLTLIRRCFACHDA